MKTLDRYIVRSFLVSAMLSLVVLMSMRIIADLFVNMDEFTKTKQVRVERTAAGVVEDIVSYYGHQALVYFRDLSGIIIVAAATFTLWRMNHTNELTAMLASGVSLHRVLLPIVFCCIGLNLLVIVDSELLIPNVKYELVRNRDDPAGTDAYQVRLVTDAQDSVWYSQQLIPSEGRLRDPVIVLRDERLAYAGHISGPEMAYDETSGEWRLSPSSNAQAILAIPGWKYAPSTERIPTHVGPARIIENAVARSGDGGPINWAKTPGIGNINIADASLGLTISAKRMGIRVDGDRVAGTTLEQARFTYHRPNNQVYATFVAPEATYKDDPRDFGWWLTGGKLVYASDLTPPDLSLRQSSNWLSLMSTTELTGLLRLQRVPDLENAMLVRHCRFADFFNNLLLLLVAVPFILSRERKIKASAGLTVLMVIVVYVFIYTSRYVGLSPALAAWLPMLIFGPVAALMLDSVKT